MIVDAVAAAAAAAALAVAAVFAAPAAGLLKARLCQTQEPSNYPHGWLPKVCVLA